MTTSTCTELHEWQDGSRSKLCTDHDVPETQLELLDVICYQLGEWSISYRLFDILPLHNSGITHRVGYQGGGM